MPSMTPGPLRFLWDTLNRFFADGGPGLAAALSFYTFFSLPALLILLLLLVGSFADPEAVQGAIVEQVSELIGRAGAEQVATIIQHASRPGGEPINVLLGLLLLTFGATTAFAQLQTALNRTWSVQPDPERGQIHNFLAKRVFSFGMVLIIALLLLVSLVLSTALAAFGDALADLMVGGWSQPLLRVFDALLSFAVVTLLFAAVYKVVPDARISWRDVWAGAFATALLFVLGKFVIGLYLGRVDPGAAYGGAGSLAVVMLWVYYSAMILLFGAELTREWAERYGGGVEPEEGAVAVEG